MKSVRAGICIALKRAPPQCRVVACLARVRGVATSSFTGNVSKDGGAYIVPAGAREAYERDGYITLRGFLTEAEVRPIEEVYDRFMSNMIPVPGKDLCDMSQGFDTKFEDFRIVNVMLPTKYYSPLRGNIYERRAASVAKQLFPDVDMGLDYDQLLNKRPMQPLALFAWHQDMAYWPGPSFTPDTRTCTFSLAIDSTTKANGCLKFIPGSHKGKEVRPHVPIGSSRDDAHAIAIKVEEDKEKIVQVEINRGDVTIHNEYVVHGSAGNNTQGNRRTYVAAFRTLDTIARERAAGFDHSHNTEINWDAFNNWK